MTTAVETLTAAPALEDYFGLSEGQLYERIEAARRQLGTRLVILGHHYQRDDVVCHADITGDSFKLAKLAAERPDADYVVFCGVHFMAESADILKPGDQKVILPDLGAGCSMADMATAEQVEDAWEQLRSVGILDEARVVPVTYMNSSAAIKAFCGEHEGVVCTSSNAVPLFDKYLKEADKLFFFPDQHLGRNTGYRMGIGLEEMSVWDYKRPYGDLGGNALEQLERSKLILWRGHCSVHARFTVEQIREARANFPGVKVVVHPECRLDVVQEADCDGSTEYIARVINESPAGSTWAVGTEINLVHRLAVENPDKTIFCLDPVVCPCATMYRVHPAYLAWVLESLVRGEVVNQIVVDEETKRDAKVALERMLAVR